MTQGIVQEMAQAAAQKAEEQVQNSIVSNVRNPLVQGVVTAGTVSNKIGASVSQTNTQTNTKTNNTQKTYGAAINSKVEKIKELESQLNDLRKLGTIEANIMAEVLEQKMQMACESDLEKLEIIIKNEYTNQLFKDAHKGDWFKDFAYSVGAAFDGFVLSIVNNITGSNLKMPSFFENYKQSFYGGSIAGNIVSAAFGTLEIVAGMATMGMGVISFGSGMAVTATGVGGAPGGVLYLAGVGEMAIGGTVVETGVQTIARSSNSLKDDIQNFKESGNETPNSTGGGGEVNIEKWNKGSFDSYEDSLEYHFNKHGKEVQATSKEQYYRKANEFSKNLKGAKQKNIQGSTAGVTRYYKNGKYIDLAPDGTIISFGKQ